MGVFDLTGKVAAVTGGGSGIGQSICTLFAKQGAKVYVLDLTAESAQGTLDIITKDGGKAEAIACDVSNQANVKEAFDKIFAQDKSLDILVNNAGIAHIGNVENTTEADMDRIYSVNIKGIYNCLQSGVEKMKASGGGAILNLASVASSVGIKDRFAYSMSKGAALTMTYSVAKDYIEDNIRCNCIAPGRVHTTFVDGFLAKTYPGQEKEMFEKLSKTQPIGRMGKPDEMAYLALYLCADESGFITGCNYPIDGGFVTLNN